MKNRVMDCHQIVDILIFLLICLCYVADQSERPESLLKMHSPALSCFYDGLKWINADIKRLICALVKSSIKKPPKPTDDMSITPLTDYFSKQMVCQLHHSLITSVNRWYFNYTTHWLLQ